MASAIQTVEIATDCMLAEVCIITLQCERLFLEQTYIFQFSIFQLKKDFIILLSCEYTWKESLIDGIFHSTSLCAKTLCVH